MCVCVCVCVYIYILWTCVRAWRQRDPPTRNSSQMHTPTGSSPSSSRCAKALGCQRSLSSSQSPNTASQATCAGGSRTHMHMRVRARESGSTDARACGRGMCAGGCRTRKAGPCMCGRCGRGPPLLRGSCQHRVRAYTQAHPRTAPTNADINSRFVTRLTVDL